MRRQVLRHGIALLRFSRWSRSRAAAFRSLGWVVRIGHLSASVLSSLARKNRTVALEDALAQPLAQRASRLDDERDEDEASLLLSPLGAALLSLDCRQTNSRACPLSGKAYYLSLPPTLSEPRQARPGWGILHTDPLGRYALRSLKSE